ncbi:hypothetical protein B0T26DRAFT_875079 [Lasiosphaeria miniovina]|uniref:Uncharacterized protein n=1 Tax=Lasiosphaeria miniovina TaxID=1954250 RepID=A0AA40A6G9_9PEZI|nr:uncharacterized protein B0T26DRAFT_875079 [Lasiosphaeria miniovina]KAK0710207.1 hypothetical protein B0T26DRAFT_875079 [Lasiosphaeria miniovina]
MRVSLVQNARFHHGQRYLLLPGYAQDGISIPALPLRITKIGSDAGRIANDTAVVDLNAKDQFLAFLFLSLALSMLDDGHLDDEAYADFSDSVFYKEAGAKAEADLRWVPQPAAGRISLTDNLIQLSGDGGADISWPPGSLA